MEGLKPLIVEDNVPGLEWMTEVFASLKANVRPVADSQRAALLVDQEKATEFSATSKCPSCTAPLHKPETANADCHVS